MRVVERHHKSAENSSAQELVGDLRLAAQLQSWLRGLQTQAIKQ